MLTFELYINNAWIKQDIVIAPRITKTFDETLDSASVVLKHSTESNAIKPMTKARFKFNGSLVSLMVVISDEVTLFSNNPVIYKHSLELVQNTRFLQKHLVRNSVFNQPIDRRKAHYRFNRPVYTGGFTTNKVRELTLGHNEKIGEVGITTKIKMLIKIGQVFAESSSSRTTDVEIPNMSFFSHYHWIDTSTPAVITPLTYDDLIYFKITTTYVENGVEITNTQYNSKKAGLVLINQEFEIPYTIVSNQTKKIEIEITALNTNNEYNSFIINQTRSPELVNTAFKQIIFHYYYYITTYFYTMYDVINTLRIQQSLTTISHTESKLFDMPDNNTDLYNVLTHTIAPQLTFTGATMYECLAEIFKYYDAIFTLDENNKLGIEYLNDYSKAKINAKFTNKMQTLKEDNFNNGYISYFENALVKESVCVCCRNTEFGFSGQDTETYAFILPHDIQSIIKAEVYIPNGNWASTSGIPQIQDSFFINKYIDMTDFIINEEVFATLEDKPNSNDYLEYNNNMQNTLYFNGSVVNIGKLSSRFLYSSVSHYDYFLKQALYLFFGRYYYDTSAIGQRCSVGLDFSNAKLKITYVARTDGRVKIENNENKYNGEMLVNQSNGSVDLNKIGLNMLGLSFKLGQQTLSATQKITTWNDRITKGQIYEYNGEKYLANIINYEFHNNFIVQTIDFIKNYNALSQRIQIDRQKRLSQISSELTIKSEDNYCEYIYMSSDEISGSGGAISLNNDYNIYLTFGVDVSEYAYYRSIDFATITTKYDDGSTIQNSIYIPLVKYVSGNSICFEMSMNHPISAGNKTTYSSNNSANTTIQKYTDENGWADRIDFQFNSYTDTPFDNNFPVIPLSSMFSVGYISSLEYYKKPNEILALNYQLQFLVPENKKYIDFIGNQFLKDSSYISGVINPKKLKIYVSTDKTYSPFDYKCLGTSYDITNINVVGGFHFTSTAVNNAKSWAIGDEEGNIYFASNNVPQTNVYSIYINSTHSRL